jgi:DNA-binding MarR family transcriptional regulator
MGEMARGIGVDPSYITALVDDLDARGLAHREPSPDDRRVKIVVLTKAGRQLAEEIEKTLSVPPAAFASLTQSELRQLRDLLDKILAAREELRAAGKIPAETRAVAPQAKFTVLEPVRLR